MMQYSTAQALGQARLAQFHHQARHDALARAGRRGRRTARQHPAPRAPKFLAALTRLASPGPHRGACDGPTHRPA